MTASSSQTGFQRFLGLMRSELAFGLLVALLSILAATAAFLGSLAGSQESDLK